MGGGGITLFVLGGWKHLPIIGSGWVLALGTVFSGVSVALANEASKAEDAIQRGDNGVGAHAFRKMLETRMRMGWHRQRWNR